MALGILETHMQKYERGHFFFTSFTTMESKLMKDLNQLGNHQNVFFFHQENTGSSFSTSAITTSRHVSRGKGKKRKMKYGDFIKERAFSQERNHSK